MALLSKEASLFARDERGELVPQEVVLELLPDKPTALLIPIPRGKLLRIAAESKAGKTSEAQDEEVILEHCAAPKYTKDEVKALKSEVAVALVTAIFALSYGVPQVQVNNGTQVQLSNEAEDFLENKHNSERSVD